MNAVLVVPLLLLLVVAPAFGQFLSDRTGLVNRVDIETGGHTFEVKTVSNFDVINGEFDRDKKRLTLFIHSSLESNLGEMIVPAGLLGGNFTFYLNGEEHFPKINSNKKISFILFNFTGSGDGKLEIFGTTYLDGLEVIQTEPASPVLPVGYDYAVGMALVAGAVVPIAVVVRRKRTVSMGNTTIALVGGFAVVVILSVAVILIWASLP